MQKYIVKHSQDGSTVIDIAGIKFYGIRGEKGMWATKSRELAMR